MVTKTLKQLRKEKEEIQKEMRERGKELVTAEIAQFFRDRPKVQAVYWDQYAPYFNDGDPCIFHVHEFFVTHGEDAEMSSRWDGWDDSGEEEQRDDASDLEDLIGDDDLLKMAFGDDCGVTVTRTENGIDIKVDHVDHD